MTKNSKTHLAKATEKTNTQKKQTKQAEAGKKKQKSPKSRVSIRLEDLAAVKAVVGEKANGPALYIGIDLGDRQSHFHILEREGNTVAWGTVETTREGFKELLGKQERARVAIEVGQHSRWVSRVVKELGHEVIVGSTRQIQLIYGANDKTDKNDAEVLARLARLDPKLLHGIEHRGEQAQLALMKIKARAMLVEMRTALINTLRGTAKSEGFRLKICSSGSFGVEALEGLKEAIKETLRPMVETIEKISEEIGGYDKQIEAMSEEHEEMKRLQQVKGVGPLISAAFVLTVEDPWRFKKSRDIGKYLGLTPGTFDSGGKTQQKRISKAGDEYLRSLLVQGAHYILGAHGPDTDLKRWGKQLGKSGGKRGKKRAVVAVARKLAVLLMALWKSGAVYDPLKNSKAEEKKQAKAAKGAGRERRAAA